ncbi:hypothetical protein EDB87DRAFT_1822841 [Lactarius vividus]|nr:hypothetical protein EDB87DRAFT_1822841 [Lactarius vividus]
MNRDTRSEKGDSEDTSTIQVSVLSCSDQWEDSQNKGKSMTTKLIKILSKILRGLFRVYHLIALGREKSVHQGGRSGPAVEQENCGRNGKMSTPKKGSSAQIGSMHRLARSLFMAKCGTGS